MIPNELEAKLAEIKLAYQSELSDKANELKLLWKALQDEAWNVDRLVELHRLVHNLAGSGATFGFVEISTQARALEIELKALLQGTINHLDAVRAEIPTLLASLIEVLLTSTAEQSQPVALTSPETPTANNLPLYLMGPGKPRVQDLVEQLGYYGYSVEHLANVDALAVRLAAQLPAGIVLAQNPDPQLQKLLRPSADKLQSYALPVVVVSEQFDLDTRLLAVRSGCDAYFTWPADAGVIASRLAQLTQRQVDEPYRVMIVEDEILIAESYAAVLRATGFSVRVVNQPLQALQTLVDFNPELILMDIYMPGCSGVELAAVIRQEDAYVGVPIVFLSSETDLSKQIHAMRQGGDEFLTKPIEPYLLESSVRCRVQRSRVLGSFLRRDSLTGLLNHTSIKEALETEVERARRRGSVFTFAMIDIDRFKEVNDTYGHPVGDRVIKGLARLLQQRLRKTDVVGRFGGEEFALLLPDTTLEFAQPVLDELRVSFKNIHQMVGESEFSVSFSCGAVAYPVYQSAEEILYHADAALYKAKHQGRNRIVIAS